jgi:hypothetical protein
MKMMVALLDELRRARRWRGGGGTGAGRKSVYGREEKTHETRVALLAEVTDGGGRLSTGLEEFEWEDPEAALSRLEDVLRCSNVEEGWLRSWELLPGVFGRLAERRVEDGVEWFKSSLRECFGREETE